MSAVSFPVKRPVGRALVLGTSSSRSQPLAAMQALGFTCAEIDDPYAAAAELLKRPLVYRAVVLSLTSLYREELTLISTLKRRLPHVDIWLTHTEGRQAAMAEAVRLGADGLLGEDGALHRLLQHPQPQPQPHATATDTAQPAPAGDIEPVAQHIVNPVDADIPSGEPVLSADELRALLQEEPSFPPDSSET
jgi:hypothetical protein